MYNVNAIMYNVGSILNILRYELRMFDIDTCFYTRVCKCSSSVTWRGLELCNENRYLSHIYANCQ